MIKAQTVLLVKSSGTQPSIAVSSLVQCAPRATMPRVPGKKEPLWAHLGLLECPPDRRGSTLHVHVGPPHTHLRGAEEPCLPTASPWPRARGTAPTRPQAWVSPVAVIGPNARKPGDTAQAPRGTGLHARFPRGRASTWTKQEPRAENSRGTQFPRHTELVGLRSQTPQTYRQHAWFLTGLGAGRQDQGTRTRGEALAVDPRGRGADGRCGGSPARTPITHPTHEGSPSPPKAPRPESIPGLKV